MTHHLFDAESPFQTMTWAHWPYSNHHSPNCNCPAMSSWRADRDARLEWDAAVMAERKRQIELGYDSSHDAEHGLQHLLSWAQDYARRGELIKSAAMIEAARALLRSNETREETLT